jgi:hypothetical protein
LIRTIAWGSKVSVEFKERVIKICDNLNILPDYLMASMAFETALTFSSSIYNKAGSGAVGLIQFIPPTATNLGTTTKALENMKAEDQLDYVEKYFQNIAGNLNTLAEVYMVIFLPIAIGKSPDFVLIDKNTNPIEYEQNISLDIDKDGKITKGEAALKVNEILKEGLKPINLG